MLLQSREMPAFPKDRDKGEKAMIARLDHRPITIAVALATVVCMLLLMVSLIITAQTVPPTLPGVSPAGGPPAHLDTVQIMML